MNPSPRWDYVQARLQARHGERLKEADWNALEAAQSPEQFIERARSGALSRFSAPLNARLSSHGLERAFREAWRASVAELAEWAPKEWRAAVLWTACVADLPAIDALLRGEMPDWARRDGVYGLFADSDAEHRATWLAHSPLAPLAISAPTTLTERWQAHWRALWPNDAASARALNVLIKHVRTHLVDLDRAAPPDRSARYRRTFARDLLRMFRSGSRTPLALFCHLALVALDLERLRGGLVRRRAFQPDRVQGAA